MWLAASLSFLVGGTLGALGGGGSILMVPILAYVLHVPVAQAIAMSLLVVGGTSAVAVLTRVQTGHIQWRTGMMFGSAAMLGAFGGGKLTALIPASVLLALFALLMLATATVMLRSSRANAELKPCLDARRKVGLALGLGAVVGLVAGLVGAGGGFLVVPALVLFAGLSMRQAIATSLLVIAMQSFAGLLGHAGHLQMDWTLAAVAVAAAVPGSLLGTGLSAKLPQEKLRRGFALLVAGVGLFVLAMQVPAPVRASVYEALYRAATTLNFVWMPLLGGVLIGLSAALFWVLKGRIAGVSGITGGLLQAPRGDRAWRALFLVGLIGGGLLMQLIAPSTFEETQSSIGILVVAGLLVGVGTTLGNGCTSGHGVCGVSRLSARSLIATGAFMSAGMLSVYLAHYARGVFG